jgi:hypothetical protein
MQKLRKYEKERKTDHLTHPKLHIYKVTNTINSKKRKSETENVFNFIFYFSVVLGSVYIVDLQLFSQHVRFIIPEFTSSIIVFSKPCPPHSRNRLTSLICQFPYMCTYWLHYIHSLMPFPKPSPTDWYRTPKKVIFHPPVLQFCK